MQCYDRRRIIVLGAAGFIGRWVTRRLSEAGASLTIPLRNPDAAGDLAPSARIVRLDLRDFDALGGLLQSVRPAIVFNLAGYGVRPEEKNEGLAQTINAELPSFLCGIDASLFDSDWPGRRIVHAGSSAEYGGSPGPITEETPPRPDTWYGRAKIAGAEAVVRTDGAINVRLFNVYGPGEHSSRLTPYLLAASRGDDPLLFTSGDQKRDFTYVEDVAEGLLRIGLTPDSTGRLVNLASGAVVSVREFVETAARILGIPADRLRFGAREGGRHELTYDSVHIDRLRQITGWSPPTDIADGLRRTYQTFQAACRPLKLMRPLNPG